MQGDDGRLGVCTRPSPSKITAVIDAKTDSCELIEASCQFASNLPGVTQIHRVNQVGNLSARSFVNTNKFAPYGIAHFVAEKIQAPLGQG